MSDDWFETATKEMAEEQDDQEIPWWEPEEGDILKSVFERASVAWSEKFDKGFFIVIAKNVDTGEHVKIGTMRAVLHKQMLEASPKKGTLMAVEFGGERNPEGGNKYYSYKVRAREADAALWAELVKALYAKGKEEASAPVEFGPATDPF